MFYWSNLKVPRIGRCSYCSFWGTEKPSSKCLCASTDKINTVLCNAGTLCDVFFIFIYSMKLRIFVFPLIKNAHDVYKCMIHSFYWSTFSHLKSHFPPHIIPSGFLFSLTVLYQLKCAFGLFKTHLIPTGKHVCFCCVPPCWCFSCERLQLALIGSICFSHCKELCCVQRSTWILLKKLYKLYK